MTDKEELKYKLEEKIKQNYPKKNILNSYIFQSYVENKIESHPNVDLNKKEFYRKNIIFTKITSIFLFLLCLSFIIYNWNEIIENPESKYFVIISAFLLTSSVFFIQGFIQTNEPVITLNEFGFTYKTYKYLFKKVENKILWSEIVVLKLWKTLAEGGSLNKIIIGKTNNEILEIEITGLDTNPFEFITIFESRINNNVA